MADKMMTTKSKASSKAEEQGVAAAAGPEALAAVSAAKMRCGGCGGKVSHLLLLHILFLQFIVLSFVSILFYNAAVTCCCCLLCNLLLHNAVWSPQP